MIGIRVRSSEWASTSWTKRRSAACVSLALHRADYGVSFHPRLEGPHDGVWRRWKRWDSWRERDQAPTPAARPEAAGSEGKGLPKSALAEKTASPALAGSAEP